MDTSARTRKEQSKLCKLSALSKLHLPYSKNNKHKNLKLLNNWCPQIVSQQIEWKEH